LKLVWTIERKSMRGQGEGEGTEKRSARVRRRGRWGIAQEVLLTQGTKNRRAQRNYKKKRKTLKNGTEK